MIEVRVRRVREDDVRLLWEWSNDSITREASFDTAPISWETHCDWFKARLADPDTRFYVIEDTTKNPVAQARFQLNGRRAAASLSVAREYRGRGVGVASLAAACTQLFDETDVESIDAYIKLGNETSIKTFARAGFSRGKDVEIRGHIAAHFVLTRRHSGA